MQKLEALPLLLLWNFLKGATLWTCNFRHPVGGGNKEKCWQCLVVPKLVRFPWPIPSLNFDFDLDCALPLPHVHRCTAWPLCFPKMAFRKRSDKLRYTKNENRQVFSFFNFLFFLQQTINQDTWDDKDFCDTSCRKNYIICRAQYKMKVWASC